MELVKGNLITLACEGNFDVIGHGCNCFCVQGAGIAVAMDKTFGTNNSNKYPLENHKYQGDINKLGQIQGHSFKREEASDLIVLNMYTQYTFDSSRNPFDYDAFRLCLKKINHIYKGLHIGLPKIGCGLAGGIWDTIDLPELEQIRLSINPFFSGIRAIIQEELTNVKITIVEL